jgi:hypothetical protein
MYSRLIYKCEVFGSKIVVENLFGQQSEIEHYEIYEGLNRTGFVGDSIF